MGAPFPTIRASGGALVIIYTTQAGGAHPIHGAYLSRSSDAHVWIPCAWTEEGYHIGPARETDLDITEDAKELLKKNNVKAEEAKKADCISIVT